MIEINGYTMEKKTISMVKANIFAIMVILIFSFISVSLYGLIWKEYSFQKMINDVWKSYKVFSVLIFLVGVFLHEVIHGLFFSIFAKKRLKSVKIGVLWKILTPYCHCNEPLRKNGYIIGAIAPAFVLGIIPVCISLISANTDLLVFGVVFLASAAGDLMLISSILFEANDTLIYDLPAEVGYCVYRKVKQ